MSFERFKKKKQAVNKKEAGRNRRKQAFILRNCEQHNRLPEKLISLSASIFEIQLHLVLIEKRANRVVECCSQYLSS